MTYPLSNFNGVMVEVWEWIWNFITICGKILLHSHFIMDVVKWKTLATNQVVIMSKIRKNIYSSDVQVTVKLHGDFRCLQALCYKYNNFSKYRLTQWIWKLPGIFEIQSEAVPGIFQGSSRQRKYNCLQDRANFTNLGHDKLS